MKHAFRHKWRWIAASLLIAALAGGFYFVRFHPIRGLARGGYESLRGWRPISGRWEVHSGVFSNSNYGRGDMLVASHSQGTDYRISADVRFDLLFPETHFGDAGLVIRTTDPEQGVDSYQGYYAGVRPDGQELILGRASFDWHQLKAVHLPAPVSTGVWYHMQLSARGCTISVSMTPASGGAATALEYNDTNCLTEGVAGLRSFYAEASWKNVEITSY